MFRYVLVILVVLTGFTVVSCKKTEPCEAVIVVRDTIGRPVAGAKVVLRQDSVVNPNTGVRADVFEEGISTSTGEAFFKFDWEAVLNVEVTFDSLSGKDYIRLEQNETVRKTVVIQ